MAEAVTLFVSGHRRAGRQVQSPGAGMKCSLAEVPNLLVAFYAPNLPWECGKGVTSLRHWHSNNAPRLGGRT